MRIEIRETTSRHGLQCDVCGYQGVESTNYLWLGFDGENVRRGATIDEYMEVSDRVACVTLRAYIGTLSAMPMHVCPGCVTKAIKEMLAPTSAPEIAHE